VFLYSCAPHFVRWFGVGVGVGAVSVPESFNVSSLLIILLAARSSKLLRDLKKGVERVRSLLFVLFVLRRARGRVCEMGDGWGEWVVWLLWGLEGLSETIGWALSFYFVFVILLYISLHAELTYNWIWRQREIPEKRTGRSNKHRSLVVIAHPDDEVMFFGPTIVGLLNKGHVYVLCLCIGKKKAKRECDKMQFGGFLFDQL